MSKIVYSSTKCKKIINSVVCETEKNNFHSSLCFWIVTKTNCVCWLLLGIFQISENKQILYQSKKNFFFFNEILMLKIAPHLIKGSLRNTLLLPSSSSSSFLLWPPWFSTQADARNCPAGSHGPQALVVSFFLLPKSQISY